MLLDARLTYFQDEHAARDHDCDAGDHCVQLTDEDVEMGNSTATTVACKDCLKRKRAILYCSERCATQRIGEHRRLAHDGSPEYAQNSFVALAEAIRETLENENQNLKMSQLT